MSKVPKHNPKRFKSYIELPDKTGFTLENCDFIFKYDEDGGWRDEYGNQYDCEGEPIYSDENNSDEDDDDQSYNDKNWSDYEDEYEKQFGPDRRVEEDFQNEPVNSSAKIIQKIGKNIVTLNQYPKDEPLRVEFEILDIGQEEDDPKEKEIITFYDKKVKGLISVFYEHEENQDPCGYFVVKNAKAAEDLVHLEGENIIGYDLTFSVPKFKEILLDPLSKEQLVEMKSNYVSIDEETKLYVVFIQGGFKCKSKQFNDWLRGTVGINKKDYEIIKMKKSEKGKIPIIKMKKDIVEKIEGTLFGEEKVKVDLYVAAVKEEEDEGETKGEEKKEEGEKIEEKAE